MLRDKREHLGSVLKKKLPKLHKQFMKKAKKRFTQRREKRKT
jgi:hypothetical protein